ncbi:MAG: hypothetical protein JW871_07440 [Endomicrobiales bacterium]|nr:hypothetical protein [Endomicrobiales bacterium]
MRKTMTVKSIFLLVVLCLCFSACDAKNIQKKVNDPGDKKMTKQFFDMGKELVLYYKGTETFKDEIYEFKKDNDNNYNVHVYGDISPSDEKLVINKDEIFFILGWSKEKWIYLELPLKKGKKWKHILRDDEHTYEVLGTTATVETPAKIFKDCIVIKDSYIANAADVRGLQENIYYFAPNHWIVKQQEYDNGKLFHEHFVTDIKYKIEKSKNTNIIK